MLFCCFLEDYKGKKYLQILLCHPLALKQKLIFSSNSSNLPACLCWLLFWKSSLKALSGNNTSTPGLSVGKQWGCFITRSCKYAWKYQKFSAVHLYDGMSIIWCSKIYQAHAPFFYFMAPSGSNNCTNLNVWHTKKAHFCIYVVLLLVTRYHILQQSKTGEVLRSITSQPAAITLQL